MRMHNSLLVITLACFLTATQAQDMEVCKEWREGGHHWWSSQSTFCCKDCCLTTLGSASDCTKSKCRKCPSHELAQCQINYNQETGQIESQGCDSTQYCKYNMTAEDEGQGIGRFHCVDKLANNETCESGLQCKTGLCYIRQKRNFCYGCIAANNPLNPDTYQAELTSHCDKHREWCSDEDYSCKPKVDNGMYCNKNNYTCKSHRCNSRLNTCVACLHTNQCRLGLTCTERGHCELVKKDAGEKCREHSDCLDEHYCMSGRCQGQRILGSGCDTHYHCESNFCHTVTKQCVDPENQQEQKSSVGLIVFAIITSTLLGAVVAYIIYRYYRKQQLKKEKIALKSSKELAEELFSPEGERRKLSDEIMAETSDEIGSSTITKISSHSRRASKELLNEAPDLFDNEEPSKPISKYGGLNEESYVDESESSIQDDDNK